MSEYDELVKRLREYCSIDKGADPIMLKVLSVVRPDLSAAADAIEALVGEVDRLTTNGIHSCWEECPRLPCVQGREIRRLASEVERLKGALEKIEQGDYPRDGRNYYNSRLLPSKHDTCVHSRAYWEDCGNCISLFARKALEAKP